LARREMRAVEEDLGAEDVRGSRARRGARGKGDTAELRQGAAKDEQQPLDRHDGCYCNSRPALAGEVRDNAQCPLLRRFGASGYHAFGSMVTPFVASVPFAVVAESIPSSVLTIVIDDWSKSMCTDSVAVSGSEI